MEVVYKEEELGTAEDDKCYVSSDSETDGDDLGDDDDYEDIRKNIMPVLNLGQTLTTLWPLSIIDHAGDIICGEGNFTDCDYPEGESLSKSLDWPSGSMQDQFFQPKHRRAPSLPSQGKLDQIKLELDEIHVTPDEEYGFNPRRTRDLQKNSGRRSVSLYVSDENADRFNFESPRKISYILSSNNLQDEKSHARNAEEAKIEKDIACLRAQPSNVEFNRKNEAKKHFQELVRGRATRKTWGASQSLRRKLSFDSYPRRRAFTEGHDYQDFKASEIFQFSAGSSQESLSDVQTVDLANSGSVPDSDLKRDDIKLAPPPILSSKTMVEVLVSNPQKGKKRRTNIPQFLNALKLPNKKTIKKFMRKKSERHPASMQPKIPVPFPVERVPIDSEHPAQKEDTSAISAPRSPSVNTFARAAKDEAQNSVQKRKRSYSTSNSVQNNSCSVCSLPKLEEGKETSEFDGTLNRKSCSTCSILVAKILDERKEPRPLYERRMSDTALAYRDERQPSCSPGKRFILKLLSPVVCGLNNDKYMNFQSCESYSSLTSCHSDVSAEADLLSQRLTDFNVQDVAEELALIDKELLIRITWQELATCGWMSINKHVTSANVMNMVEFFNRVAMMVATSILVEETAYLRAKAISKLIKLAAKCRHLKNYNSLRAVLAGLQCTPIYRLEASWKQVRARRKRLFGELSNIMSETENFITYRTELSRSLNDPPCLPFLGDFLTQIAQTQAYLAMRRRKSLAKQRLEKASTSSTADNAKTENEGSANENKAALDVDKATDDERITNKSAVSLNEIEVFVNKNQCTASNTNVANTMNSREEGPAFSSKVCDTTEFNCNECLDEKLTSTNNEVNELEKPDVDECKLCSVSNETSESNDTIESFDGNDDSHENISQEALDEVDLQSEISSKNCDCKNGEAITAQSTPVAPECREGRKAVIGSSSSETDPFEDESLKLNKFERERIRRSITGITTAMFQSGSSYCATGDESELVEALNEYLENPEISEVPVFSELHTIDEHTVSKYSTVPAKRDSVSEDQKCSFEENNCHEDVLKSGTGKPRKNVGSDSCVCEDHGVGSASSYDLSPTTPVSTSPLAHAILLSGITPVLHSALTQGKNDALGKKTHARNDSNDSGVVLHNGRSSRASEDLNGSRENLNANVSEQHENLAFEDSKIDSDVMVDDSTDATERKSSKTISALEKDLSDTLRIEEQIKKRRPPEEETKFNKKEFQFWQYQIAAMKYQITSKSILRKFLLNACYNSEDENYSLSLKREPIAKKH